MLRRVIGHKSQGPPPGLRTVRGMRISASLSTSQLAILRRSFRLMGRGGLVGLRQGLTGRLGRAAGCGARRSLLIANLRTSAMFCAP